MRWYDVGGRAGERAGTASDCTIDDSSGTRAIISRAAVEGHIGPRRGTDVALPRTADLLFGILDRRKGRLKARSQQVNGRLIWLIHADQAEIARLTDLRQIPRAAAMARLQA